MSDEESQDALFRSGSMRAHVWRTHSLQRSIKTEGNKSTAPPGGEGDGVSAKVRY